MLFFSKIIKKWSVLLLRKYYFLYYIINTIIKEKITSVAIMQMSMSIFYFQPN